MKRPALVLASLAVAACGPHTLGSIGAGGAGGAGGGGGATTVTDGAAGQAAADAPLEHATSVDAPADQGGDDRAPDVAPAADAPVERPPIPDAVKMWEPADPDGGAPLVITAVGYSTSEVAVGTVDGQVWVSESGNFAAPHWLRVDTFTQAGRTFGLPALPVTSVVVDPTDAQTIYASFAGSTLGHKVYVTHTGGSMWTELGGGLESLSTRDVWTLSMNPQSTQRLYAVTPDSVWYTVDGGNTWALSQPADEPLKPPFASTAFITAMTYGANVYEVWVAGSDGEIFHVADTRTLPWVSIATSAMPAAWITRLTARPGGGLYATFGADATDSGMDAAAGSATRDRLWSTTDNLAWENLHNPNLPPGMLYGLSVNPYFQTTLYVIEPGGAHRSDDGGVTWWP